jgi:hypothetical protein
VRQAPAQPPIALPRSAIEIAEENVLLGLIRNDPSLSNMIMDGVQINDLFLSSAAKELARRLLIIRNTSNPSSGKIAVSLFEDDKAVYSLASKLLAGDNNEAPLSNLIVSDSLERLRKEATVRQEKSLKLLADSGDTQAHKELVRVVRETHLVTVDDVIDSSK